MPPGLWRFVPLKVYYSCVCMRVIWKSVIAVATVHDRSIKSQPIPNLKGKLSHWASTTHVGHRCYPYRACRLKSTICPMGALPTHVPIKWLMSNLLMTPTQFYMCVCACVLSLEFPTYLMANSYPWYYCTQVFDCFKVVKVQCVTVSGLILEIRRDQDEIMKHYSCVIHGTVLIYILDVPVEGRELQSLYKLSVFITENGWHT